MVLGWLWVSTLRQTARSSSRRMKPALSWNALSTKPGLRAMISSLGPLMKVLKSERMVSVVPPAACSIVAAKMRCLQCSLHVWAITSNSTSVGSRPHSRKVAWTSTMSSRNNDNFIRLLRARRSSSSRPRMGMDV